MGHFLSSVMEKIGDLIPLIITAIVVYFLGYWAIKLLIKIVKKAMEKKGVDTTVQGFVNQLVYWVLNIVLILAVVQIVGIPVSSFIGALTASAVAIGLALQGSLSNFAGGILLLIIKPFKIGDIIEAKGHTGVVKRIGMFYTYINKFNNELLMIPNGPLFADNVINYSKEPTRRVKIVVGVSYSADIKKVRETLLSIGHSCPNVLSSPEPAVYVEELADSSVNISIRIWVKSEDYYLAFYYMMENIKTRFDQSGIEIPFPQRELIIKKQ